MSFILSQKLSQKNVLTKLDKKPCVLRFDKRKEIISKQQYRHIFWTIEGTVKPVKKRANDGFD